MKSEVRIQLNAQPEQAARLLALQAAFAQVCNALAPTVQRTGVWNRVALHHMAYKALREQFPAMGSQMVCNAIYSVSRACRLVFQTAGSPFHLSKLAGKSLPLLRFTDTCPVYFDRHTLSIKAGQASMYTLDGRMKFQLALRPEDEQAFHTRKLHEIVLQRGAQGFELSFQFGEVVEAGAEAAGAERGDGAEAAGPTDAVPPDSVPPVLNPPEYLMVEETA